MSKSEDQNISRKDTRKSGYQKEVIAGFEKLWVWQKAHELMLEVHKICQVLPRAERFKKRYQLEKSSSSVPDNIAEGHTTYYYQDKIKGFNVARKEAGETQNHISRYEEVIRGINGYIRWVRQKRGDKK